MSVSVGIKKKWNEGDVSRLNLAALENQPRVAPVAIKVGGEGVYPS
jgi:hypothetical protein